MTEVYESFRLPSRLIIKCPDGAGEAIFAFPWVMELSNKVEFEIAKAHKEIDYIREKDRYGRTWNIAIFQPNPTVDYARTSRFVKNSFQVPDIAGRKSWSISTHEPGHYYCYQDNKPPRSHTLKWPDDAYYSLLYKGQHLWAFDREHMIAIRDFIALKKRKYTNYYVRHVPSIFKTKEARNRLPKEINKLLEGKL